MSNSKIFDKILLGIIYVGSFAVVAIPLVVIPQSYFPYIIIKTIILRIIIELVFLSWLVLIIYRPEFRPKKTLLFWILGFFILVWLVSTLTSSSFLKSFWGNWERMGGFFNFLHYFLWWLVIANVFKSIKQWYRILNWSIIISVAIGLYSVAQRYALFFTLEAGLVRVNGTIGNSAYLAAYMLIHVFISWYFFAKSKKLWVKLLYLGAFGLQLFIMLLTSTRGAQLAFAFSLVLFLLFSIIFKFYKEKSVRLFVLISALAVLFGIFVLIFHNQPWVRSNYYLGRFGNITLKDNTIQTRFISWKAGYQGFKDYLLTGVGPENYNIVFNRYFTPDFYLYTGDEVWFDRAHNTLVDMAAVLGIFGIISYLSIFLAILYIFWQFYKKQGYVVNITILVLLFITYFIQNIFVFDSLNTYIPFFLMLGLVDFFYRLNKKQDNVEVKAAKDWQFPKPIAASLGILAFLILFFSINLQQIKANQYTYSGFVASRTGNYEVFNRDYRKSIATAINPIDPIFLFAQGITDLTVNNLDKLSKEEIEKNFSEAVTYAKRGVELDPKNVFSYYILAKLYNGYAEITQQGIYLNKALEALEEAKKLSPNRIRLYWVEAQTYIIAGKYDEALEALDKSIALIDSIPDPYWFKSIVYFEQEGKEDLAYEAAAMAVKNNYRFSNINDINKLIPHFEETGEDEVLIKLYQKIISLEPAKTAYYERLAFLYEETGEIQKAMDIIKRAAEAVPAYSDRAYEIYTALENKL